ncbi:MAG: ClbS/DfsB family four-helix bundle protein [Bacteroidota bacterium]
MPRPKNKTELQLLSRSNYEKLITYVDSLSPKEQEMEFPSGYLNRSIRDVLAHLHHWHLMMLEWYRVGMGGKKPDMPSKGYTWKTVPDLNRKIHEMYSVVDLAVIRKSLDTSFAHIQEKIAQHTDTELFEKKYYPWTGSTSLGAYFISASSSHYDWALKLIKKCKKSHTA